MGMMPHLVNTMEVVVVGIAAEDQQAARHQRHGDYGTISATCPEKRIVLKCLQLSLCSIDCDAGCSL